MVESTCLTIIGDRGESRISTATYADLNRTIERSIEAFTGQVKDKWPLGSKFCTVFEGSDPYLNSSQALLAALEIDGFVKEMDIRMGISTGEDAARQSELLAENAEGLEFRILMSEIAYQHTGCSVEAFGNFVIRDRKKGLLENELYCVGISLTKTFKPGEVPVYTHP